MGRSYWFECVRCGYRAKVSGRPDRGLNFFVQTIACRDCKELYDAVVKLRLPAETHHALAHRLNHTGLARPRFRSSARLREPKTPPRFEAALNRLVFPGAKAYHWVQFPLQCPVSPLHRVKSWTEPDKCPRCGMYLERHALPFRIWD